MSRNKIFGKIIPMIHWYQDWSVSREAIPPDDHCQMTTLNEVSIGGRELSLGGGGSRAFRNIYVVQLVDL